VFQGLGLRRTGLFWPALVGVSQYARPFLRSHAGTRPTNSSSCASSTANSKASSSLSIPTNWSMSQTTRPCSAVRHSVKTNASHSPQLVGSACSHLGPAERRMTLGSDLQCHSPTTTARLDSETLCGLPTGAMIATAIGRAVAPAITAEHQPAMDGVTRKTPF
jgi:hypothetical protein